MFAMPSNVAPQSALSLQNACAPGKFAEVFDRGSRICDPVYPNEDAVDAAEKVPRLFGDREGWTGFYNDLANRGKVYGFGVKQLLDALSVSRPRLSNGVGRADFVSWTGKESNP